MCGVITIGRSPWTREDMTARLAEFSSLYEDRPIRDNAGGMLSSHMFFMWFALKVLMPKAVVESGVWLGQGTWFIENACPRAQLYCIDPVPDRIRYRSARAVYHNRDFATLDWTRLPKEETVLFFDDHQNAYERVKTAKWFGFRHLLFEDNYPPAQGDCYSLKKAFAHAGFHPNRRISQSWMSRLAWRVESALKMTRTESGAISPNEVDAKYLRENLDIYYEFPPIFRTSQTRWGDRWDDQKYPTAQPLMDVVASQHLQRFMDEATNYTWMCYVKLAEPHG